MSCDGCPFLASLAPHQPRSVRDAAHVLECGGLVSGQGRVQEALALRSDDLWKLSQGKRHGVESIASCVRPALRKARPSDIDSQMQSGRLQPILRARPKQELHPDAGVLAPRP